MALWIELLFILVGMCNGAKGPGPIMSPHTDNFDDEEKSTTPSYTNGLFNITTNTDRVSHMSRNVQTSNNRSLWLASIWWEAGYQQGKSDSKSATCNAIRVAMADKEMFSEHELPNCHVNGHWTPLQCGDTHCWCVFLDAGYRIQTIPFVGRNDTLICPKLTLFGKDPCRMTPTPLVTCKNTRSARMKWIYDRLQEKCIYIESCTGFQSEIECTNTCVPEPFSLCTLPLNEGNCTKPTGGTSGGSLLGNDVGLLSTITETRYSFDRTTSTCKAFEFGRCGGNSNNFKSNLDCMGSCIKDTQLTVMAKIGNQVLRLTLPAWLVVQLNLSATEARDVPPTMVPMIFEHSFGPAASGDQNEGGIHVVQMQDPIAPRAANAEPEDLPEIVIPPRQRITNISAQCRKSPNPGMCRSWTPRWYYSEEARGCKIFGWGGCWGNIDRDQENNFSGKYECVLKCAPIKNVRDQEEVNLYLNAGDPIDEPDRRMPAIQMGPEVPVGGVQNFDVEYRGLQEVRNPRPMYPP